MSIFDTIIDIVKKHVDEGLLEKFGLLANGETTEEFTALAGTIGAIETDLSDGFQWQDLFTIGGALINDLMLTAEKYRDATGEEKKEFVQSAIWAAYRIIDQGVDGDKNRIDIPWVPSGIEERMERRVVDIASSFAIESVVKYWNRNRV